MREQNAEDKKLEAFKRQKPHRSEEASQTANNKIWGANEKREVASKKKMKMKRNSKANILNKNKKAVKRRRSVDDDSNTVGIRVSIPNTSRIKTQKPISSQRKTVGPYHKSSSDITPSGTWSHDKCSKSIWKQVDSATSPEVAKLVRMDPFSEPEYRPRAQWGCFRGQLDTATSSLRTLAYIGSIEWSFRFSTWSVNLLEEIKCKRIFCLKELVLVSFVSRVSHKQILRENVPPHRRQGPDDSKGEREEFSKMMMGEVSAKEEKKPPKRSLGSNEKLPSLFFLSSLHLALLIACIAPHLTIPFVTWNIRMMKTPDLLFFLQNVGEGDLYTSA